MRQVTLAILIAAMLTGTIASAHAQSGGGYELTWWTIDGGGTTNSNNGDYSLAGTFGQPDAGTLSGGGYTLFGGFWSGAAASVVSTYKVYLPIVIR